MSEAAIVSTARSPIGPASRVVPSAREPGLPTDGLGLDSPEEHS